MKKADDFIKSEADEALLKRYESYSSSLSQLTQILRKIDDKRDIQDEIENLLAVHKKVEDRLIKEKQSLFDNIRKTICREHVRHKYQSEDIRSSMVNKKF